MTAGTFRESIPEKRKTIESGLRAKLLTRKSAEHEN